MPLSQLRRVRWAVRATLLLGVAASVTANVLHARDNPISQAIAAWPPLALLLTVELISRVPVHRRALAFTRFAATAVIAGIAAWVSYWHMAGVAARYGETGASPYLLPLSVDGLIVVASICLVELAGRIQTLSVEPAAAQLTAVPAVPAVPTTVPTAVPAAVPGLIPEPVAPLKPVPAASSSLASELAGLLPTKAPAGGTTPPGESIPELKPAATKRPRATAAARSTTPRATTTARATSQPRRAPAKAEG